MLSEWNLFICRDLLYSLSSLFLTTLAQRMNDQLLSYKSWELQKTVSFYQNKNKMCCRVSRSGEVVIIYLENCNCENGVPLMAKKTWHRQWEGAWREELCPFLRSFLPPLFHMYLSRASVELPPKHGQYLNIKIIILKVGKTLLSPYNHINSLASSDKLGF